MITMQTTDISPEAPGWELNVFPRLAGVRMQCAACESHIVVNEDAVPGSEQCRVCGSNELTPLSS